LVAGLVMAAAAFLTGPSVSAVRIRSRISAVLGWIRRSGEHHGVSTGPVGRWTDAHRRGLRIGAIAVAAIIFIFWGRPTAAVVIWLAVLLIVVLGLIELIGRPPGPRGCTAGERELKSPKFSFAVILKQALDMSRQWCNSSAPGGVYFRMRNNPAMEAEWRATATGSRCGAFWVWLRARRSRVSPSNPTAPRHG
jgi:hypothetical protein